MSLIQAGLLPPLSVEATSASIIGLLGATLVTIRL